MNGRRADEAAWLRQELSRIAEDLETVVDTARVDAIIRFSISRGEFLTYLDVAKPLGLFSGGAELAECLRRIMLKDLRARAPQSVAAVLKAETGRPGDGFFETAAAIGASAQGVARERFWRSQVEALGLDPSVAVPRARPECK